MIVPKVNVIYKVPITRSLDYMSPHEALSMFLNSMLMIFLLKFFMITISIENIIDNMHRNQHLCFISGDHFTASSLKLQVTKSSLQVRLKF